MITQPSAEEIAFALDKPRRTGPDQYLACCPVHGDRSPSFSIRQTADRVLFYCHAGCTQEEVLAELRSRGLWPTHNESAPVASLIDRSEMLAFCLVHEQHLKQHRPTTPAHQRLYRQYQRVLCSPFTPEEVAEMNLYCLCYRDSVRAGRVPTREEDHTFRDYSRAVYDVGVIPYEW